MKFSFEKIRNPIFLIAVMIGAGSLHANQPTPPEVDVDADFVEGKMGLVQLINRERYPVEVELNPGEGSTLLFRTQKVKLAAGEKTAVRFPLKNFRGADLMREGRQVLHVDADIIGENKARVKGFPSHSVFDLRGGTVRKLPVEESYVRSRLQFKEPSKEAVIDLGAGFKHVAKIQPLYLDALEVPQDARFEEVKRPDISKLLGMKLGQLPQVEIGSSNGAARIIRPIPDPRPITPGPIGPIGPRPIDTIVNPDLNASTFQPEFEMLATKRISGKISLKKSSDTYTPAWGWVVKAWQKVANIWIFMGWTYVDGSGNWSIPVGGAIPGIQIYVEYLAANRFVQIEDPSGNTYAWGDYWNYGGNDVNVGSRFIDLSKDSKLPGIDALYVGATEEWIRFYELGINALRDEPVRVTYPNSLSTGKCQNTKSDGTKYAWSCSYWSDGHIYLIPDHANATVIQHEIAHSINSYYWKNSGGMPSDAGKQHSLSGCTTNGTGLTEGWADFVVYWIQNGQKATATNNAVFGRDIEPVSASDCSGQSNEMRVAMTFWDLYDYWNDGNSSTNKYDSMLFVSEAAPVTVYLNNNHGKMSDYLANFKSGQSTYWQGEIEKIFRLNTIIP